LAQASAPAVLVLGMEVVPALEPVPRPAFASAQPVVQMVEVWKSAVLEQP